MKNVRAPVEEKPAAEVRSTVDERVDERSVRPERLNTFARVKGKILGTPLATERLVHERLGKPTALAVFASDNLSSSAYATEEILRVLLYTGFGTLAFARVVPITVALLAVLGILLFSYRQTIKAYPQAGGAYLVTRDNFGLLPAQVAGVALLTDYILTVSVSVAAGTAALTSVFEGLFPWRVPITLGFIAIVAFGNLRGVRESGKIFRVPTYFFIGMMGTLLAVSFWRLASGDLPENASQFPIPDTKTFAGIALVFLVLKAFASGGAAVTGVEAISNGVPAFKPPEWKNAITTLMWMGALLGVMFFGLSILAARLQIVPDPEEKVTVLSQVGRAAFGTSPAGHALFLMLQVGTILILVLAANTSFADFPRLASFQAGDSFLPHQLTRYGDRLVFSNGIVALAVFAGVLIVMFQASVTRLIPLYAIGVFTSFTFSQLGMAKRHLTLREPSWRTGLFFNGLGGIVSGVMTVIIATTKFAQGAWIILIVIPLTVVGLLRIHKHYERARVSLRDPARRSPTRDLPRQTVVIPVGEPGASDAYAAAYARRVLPRDVRLVHFAEGGTKLDDVLAKWEHLELPIDLLQQHRTIPDEIRDYVRRLRSELGGDTLVNVIIPETVRYRGPRHVLHTFNIQRIKSTLAAEDDVVVTNVAHHPAYETLEPAVHADDPRRVMEGWRHVAVVLVSNVHNATVRSLRYARSLRADQTQCVHVEVDAHETEEVREAWRDQELGAHLEILPSPFRQIATPIHSYVRGILDEQPRTFVTLVIPDLVVKKRWHRLLHNQTALTLKGTFLFEPSVVVSAVPYEL
ncbi:MAG TPA: APC family permease [Actinomycetota bacterium]|jgi:amino acid transporter|nr:APC family permease [Actinomycetota bacterium]